LGNISFLCLTFLFVATLLFVATFLFVSNTAISDYLGADRIRLWLQRMMMDDDNNHDKHDNHGNNHDNHDNHDNRNA